MDNADARQGRTVTNWNNPAALLTFSLPSKGLQSINFKAWMWAWDQKLHTRIHAELENVIVEERSSVCCHSSSRIVLNSRAL